MTSISPIQNNKTALIAEDLISRFINHVHTDPHKIAVVTTEQTLTYHQLYLEVTYCKNLLGPYAGRNAIICLERGPRLLAMLLAMQWLSITYIPVDPAIPIERLRIIIEDSQPQILLCNIQKHPQFAILSCTLVDVTPAPVFPESVPTQIIEPYIPKQTSIAYIIYTSGSTGNPKGVIISYQALHNLLSSLSKYFLNNEQELALAITTVSFDISVVELYLPIWQQKTLFLADQHQHKDPLSLAYLLNRYPITFIQTTPSYWTMLLSLEWASHPNLVALCGGEPLSQPLAQRLLEKVSELWNVYGPTEATVWCALKQILANTQITIGQPIDNMSMYVLDNKQCILPPGVKGELYIGGIGLAEGYINNSKLTYEKFITHSDPFLGRLYQVGDLASKTPNGEFIIYGRTDNQIKLHGYRIELEEIEAQIQTYPGIQESAVAVYQEQLIAYICWTQQTLFSKTNFIQYLAKYLPEYMLPKHLMMVQQLPKTVSGKIDRKALPSPVIASSSNTTNTPLTPLQASVIHIWKEVFALNHINLHDDFFELGGHSLLATRIVVKIAKQMRKKMGFADFYRAPTVEKFSEAIKKAPPVADSIVHIPDHKQTLPLQEYQFLYWLSRISEPTLRRLNVVERRRLQGPIDQMALNAALQLVLKKHEIFSYHIHRFYPLQSLQPKPSKQWQISSLSHLSNTEIESYLTQKYR